MKKFTDSRIGKLKKVPGFWYNHENKNVNDEKKFIVRILLSSKAY